MAEQPEGSPDLELKIGETATSTVEPGVPKGPPTAEEENTDDHDTEPGFPAGSRLISAMRKRTRSGGSRAPSAEPPATEPSSSSSISAADSSYQQTIYDEERGLSDAGLPRGVRVRRPVWRSKPTEIRSYLRGRSVRVIGDGPLAVAIRRELLARGASPDQQATDIMDTSTSARQSLDARGSIHPEGLQNWLCVVRLPPVNDPSEQSTQIEQASSIGVARALASSCRRISTRTLYLEPDIGDSDAAFLACDELAASHRSPSVKRSRRKRQVQSFEIEGMPPQREDSLHGLNVLIVGAVGEASTMARAVASRSPKSLLLISFPSQSAEIEALREELSGQDCEVHTWSGELHDPAVTEHIIREIAAAGFNVDLCIQLCISHHPQERPGTENFEETLSEHGRVALNLAARLDPSTRLALIGSVEGRLGTPDRPALCSVHEIFDRISQQRPHTLFLASLPWVSELDGTEPSLTAEGLQVAPARPLCETILDLIAQDCEGQRMLCARLGSFEPTSQLSLLTRVEHHGDRVSGWHLLSLASSSWLSDYSVDGVPLLPLSIGLEMLAELASIGRPGRVLQSFEDIVCESLPRVYAGSPTEIIVEIELQGPHRLKGTLSTVRQDPQGRKLKRHISARLDLAETSTVSSLPCAFLPEDSVSKSSVYRRFPQTGAFQVIDECNAVAREALLATGQVEHAYIANSLLTSPLTIELAIQSAASHRMLMRSEIPTPTSIDHISLLETATNGEPISAMVQLQPDGIYNVDVDQSGRNLIRLRGLEFVTFRKLKPEEALAPPDDGWSSAVFDSPENTVSPKPSR